MALPLALIPTAIAAGQGIYNMFQGINQQNAASDIVAKRKKYVIPGGIGANLRMYQDLANSHRMPGQSQAEDNVKGNTANMINAISQSGGGVNNMLAAIAGLHQNQNQAMNDIATQGAQFQLMNKDKLANAQNVMSQYQDQAFDYNENQPYLMALSRKMALEEAGAENVNNALTSLTNAGTSLIGAGDALGINKAKKATVMPSAKATAKTGKSSFNIY